MRSEGYCSWVCVSVKSHLTYGASVRPENAVTYSAGNEGKKNCGVFSETAPLQRSSTPSVVRPCVQSAIFPAESTHAHYTVVTLGAHAQRGYSSWVNVSPGALNHLLATGRRPGVLGESEGQALLHPPNTPRLCF